MVRNANQKARFILALLVGAFLVYCLVFGQGATTYYVDFTGGLDTNNGTSPETAWKTINKVNTSSFNAGDSILFKRGSEWREQLTVPSSGSSGNHITFGAYGTGADPIISGADVITSWTQCGSWEAHNITLNADLGTASRNYRMVSAANDFTNSGTKVRIAVSSSTAGGCSIDGSSIGVMTTVDDMDNPTNGTFKRILWDGGSDTTTIAANSTKVSDELTFTFTKTNRHGIHLYSTDREFRYVVAGEGMYYNTPGIDDTLTQTVAYTWDNGTVGISKIEVWSTGTAYQKSGVTTEPQIVVYDGTVLTENDGATTGVGANEWDWAADVLYVNVGEDPGTGTLEASQRSTIDANAKTYIAFEDLEFKYSHGYGAYLDTITNWTIDNVNFNTCRGGVLMEGVCSGIAVQNCTISNVQDSRSGIVMQIDAVGSLNDITIDTNTISNASHMGIFGLIYTNGGDGDIHTITVSNNTVSSSTSEGIHFDSEDTGRLFYNIDIDGNTVNNNTKTGIRCRYFTSTSGQNYIRNNTVYENCAGDLPGGIWVGNADDFIVESNTVYDNHTNDYDGRGIYFDNGTTNSIMRYNVIYNHIDHSHADHDSSAGIAVTGVAASGGNSGNQIYYNISYDNYYGIVITGDDIDSLTVYNNVFYSNDDSGIWIRDNVDDLAEISVKNNIFSDNTAYGMEKEGATNSGLVNDYNCIYNNTAGTHNNLTQGGNSITTNPTFIDASTDKFSLQSTSPCIDAGTNVGLTQDYIGRKVPQGKAPDIGAYEYPQAILAIIINPILDMVIQPILNIIFK